MRDKKLTTERPLGPRRQEVAPHSPGIEPLLDSSYIRPVGERISQPGAQVSPLQFLGIWQGIADAVLTGVSPGQRRTVSVRQPDSSELSAFLEIGTDKHDD